MDNYFKNCPAKMSYGGFTDYRTSHTRELHHMQIAGMNRSDDFRLFAQANAEKIMNNEWNKLRTTKSCRNYPCMHNTGTSTTPQDQYNEMMLYNNVKKGFAQVPQCEVFEDYTLSSSGNSVKYDSSKSK